MSTEATEEKNPRFELLCGVCIAVIAAILAVADLGAGKFGDDELIAHNQKNNAYLWYQSKGIKETLVEGQRDTLQALLAAGSIAKEQQAAVEALVTKLNDRVKRYGREKNEILKGSSNVGRENWAQEVEGQLGRVTGASEWEAKANALGDAGDLFDYSTLFLQLSLVMGAISLVLQNKTSQRSFFLFMIALSLVGTGFCIAAYRAALAI